MSMPHADFSAAFLTHPDGLILINAQHQITAINPAAVSLLGIDIDAWIGQPISALHDTLDLPIASAPSEITWWHEYQQQYLRVTTNPTPSEVPHAGTLYVFSTESQASREIQRDVAVMSHELRIPMVSIQGYTDLLLRDFFGPLSTEQHDALEHVRRATSRLVGYTRQISLLNMLYFRHTFLDSQSFELGDLLESLRPALERQSAQQQLTFTIAYPEPDITITANDHYIRTILEQLLDNAVNYTPAGGQVTLSVRTNEQQILIDVEDTGVGIASDYHGLLFRRYAYIPQANEERTARGLGVGLHIAKTLAERNGGTILVRSNIDEGSTFTLVLPHTSQPSSSSELA